MHMNFMAKDVKTGLEKTFFAELCMFNDVDDGNSGFVATTCEIIDGNSEGGRRIKLLCTVTRGWSVLVAEERSTQSNADETQKRSRARGCAGSVVQWFIDLESY